MYIATRPNSYCYVRWGSELSCKTTCSSQYLSYLNPKGEHSSCKIDGSIANHTSKLKWTWQTYFLSLTLLILKINTMFEDFQMMLKWFFDFSTGFRFSKVSVECSVHICNCPWFRRHFPNDKAMLSLADFIDCLAKCFKILTSRVIRDAHNDKWKDALEIHYEVF